MIRQLLLVTVVLIISVMTSSSHAADQSCKCSGEGQKKKPPSLSNSYDTIYDAYPIITDSGPYSFLEFSNQTNFTTSSSNLTNSSAGLLIPIGPLTWRRSQLLPINSISFNISVYRPESPAEASSQGLAFILLPVIDIYASLNSSVGVTRVIPVEHDKGSLVLYPKTKTTSAKSEIRDTGTTVSAEIGAVQSMSNFTNSTSASSAMGINITIIPTEASNRAGMEYLVWIDFDNNSTVNSSSSSSISVFVEEASRPKPDKPVISKDIYISEFARLQGCFFSSIGQLSRIHGLSVTFDDLRDQQVRTSSRLAIILASVFGSLGGSAVIAAVVAWWYINSSYRRWKKELDQLAKSMQSLPGVPLKISFADISKATSNFHETMKLGTGAFGAVYRCKLQSLKGQSMEVAVKKFTRSDTRCYEDFLAEVSIINRLRHKNIVPLVGWSYHKGEPLLVYEYMPNGSLDRHLFPRAKNSLQQNSSAIRQWDTRYNIVSDIATGLHYVHHEYEPKVLHRDIKASNILVDSTFRARLGDFGLACTLAVNRNSISGDVAGTFGYIAPDYAMNFKATQHTDVYAFGVLVLEVVTGKKAMMNDTQFGHITDWVWHLHYRGRILEAVDSTLSDDGHGEFKVEEARRLLLLGLACSNPNPSDRPTMVDAVQIIAKSAPAPVVPLEKPRVVCFPPLPLPRGSSSESTDYYDTAKGSLQIERSVV